MLVYAVMFDFSGGLSELDKMLRAPATHEDVGAVVYQTPFEAERVARYSFDAWKYSLGLEPTMWLVVADVDWEEAVACAPVNNEERTSTPRSAMESCPFPQVTHRELKQDVAYRVLRRVTERYNGAAQ